MNKKEIKIKAYDKYKNDRLAIKDLKAKIKATEDKDKLTQELITLKSTIKNYYKTKITNASEEELKAIKKEKGYYKKKQRRPFIITIWVIILLLLLNGYSSIAPILNEIDEVTEAATNGIVTDSPEAVAAKENGLEVAQQITDEGLVLLKNEDNTLPLTEDDKINVFGFGAMNYKMGGGGSGATNTDGAVSLFEGFDNAGINYNQDLYNFYADLASESAGDESVWTQMAKGMLGGSDDVEDPSTDYITDEVMQNAKEYSDTALVVLTSMGTEASDASVEQLQLSEAETALLDTVTANFENVIVLVNSGFAMDLSYLYEYPEIKAALWIGNPGALGANSIGKVLTGEVTPSGRLTDTYLKDITQDPAVQNIGDYDYENIDGMARLDYEEGIYVGYRYYETRALEDPDWYSNTVLYPFGYGLSYTTFKQELVGHDVDDGVVTMNVKVTNTGDVAGKEVVQGYFSAPYYEGGIEKSAIELAAFDKTDLLNPGESQTLTLTFDVEDMASWDTYGEEAYVLDAGDYTISIGKNAHEMIDSFTYNVPEKVVYEADPDTNTPYENEFSQAEGDDVNYMSRSDFAGTFPTDDDINLVASQETIDAFNYEYTEIDGEEAITGEENGIMLADLKGLAFDDPMWDEFLNQFTIDEMIGLVSYGGYHTRAIERLGVPETVLLDGPAGWNVMFGPSIDSASYPSELLLASSFNRDLAYALGDAVGQEGAAYGIDMWYAPAMNIHRSPLGGRNWEYLSEDPYLSGIMASEMIKGAQDNGIMVTMKHFILNEQEVNARSGVMVWANEQAIRELYLKPFEIVTKEADPSGVMASFINIGTDWSGGSEALLNNVLREEWGFDGMVTTDAQLGDWMDPVDAVVSGNEIMLSIFKGASNVDALTQAYEEMPVLISNSLRDRTHQIMYSILNDSNAVDDMQ